MKIEYWKHGLQIRVSGLLDVIVISPEVKT